LARSVLDELEQVHVSDTITIIISE
jgi:hypothetical protein